MGRFFWSVKGSAPIPCYTSGLWTPKGEPDNSIGNPAVLQELLFDTQVCESWGGALTEPSDRGCVVIQLSPAEAHDFFPKELLSGKEGCVDNGPIALDRDPMFTTRIKGCLLL